MEENLRVYFQICKGAEALLVTTSCFTAWREARKTNGGAKVIPAISSSLAANATDGVDNVRVFFFDDNINLHLGGSHDVDGICNLRDIQTGEFVDFSEGENGFTCSYEFRHTCVHHSSKYRNVLVQANILDAMANLEYFTSLIVKYANPGEKLIIYVDVNGTLVWDDTMAGKGTADLLLSTMFRFVEVRPRNADGYEIEFGGKPPIKVTKPTALKQLVSDLSNKDNEFYQAFWCLSTCRQFMEEVMKVAKIGWQSHRGELSCEDFFNVYEEYLQELSRHATVDGITKSWFILYESMTRGGHAVILNSFGVDSRRVVQKSVPDEREVLQITVNHKMWGKRDLDAWNAQFKCG